MVMNRLTPFVACFVLFFIWSCSPSPRYTTSRPVPKSSPGSPSGKEGPMPKSKPYTQNGKQYKPTDRPPIGKKFRGSASFYADDFHGKKTSNGETFDMHGLTAAHKTWPFNTWIEVKNLENGRTVIVRINDRGPFVGDRILDLSYGAAKELRMIGSGVIPVEITILR